MQLMITIYTKLVLLRRSQNKYEAQIIMSYSEVGKGMLPRPEKVES